MRSLEFHFDFRSPYSYLALTRLPLLDAEIDYRPFDVLDVMGKVGNVPTSVTCQAKRRYLQQDLRRWAMHYQVPIAPNPGMANMDTRAMLHAMLAARRKGLAATAASALFKAVWASQVPIASEGDIASILEGAAIDVAALGDLGSTEAAAELAAVNAEAAERGIFGAPTFFVGEQQFFGNDRLEFVAAALEAQP
ncbi:2-hydroxychromene-2-carboxylate isomerase [Novosphingobium sp. UBA1939]|jgi:2-hydroxychromene-2-carboxylate isomerase|uniref:2-hydroxychromene-2-carboxylate isomerase n=1 Tax=Novosphingobium sp. UBA1939 TaxID=1946982 RepID=UPI0025F0DD12|nr:2-hydroxychromene-2-carboxylate isomerase [Novosphingobium sp. UBA1939]